MFGKNLVVALTILWIGQTEGNLMESNATGIIFSSFGKVKLTYKDWKVCYHFNLTEYYQEIEDFKPCIDKIQSLCMILEDDNCKTITGYFKKEYEGMGHDVYKLNEGMKRSKREAPLRSVGRFNHWLFGVIDEETGEKYEEKINNIVSTVNDHYTLQNEQTTLIKKTIAATKTSMQGFKTNIFDLNKNVKLMKNAVVDQFNITDMKIQLNFMIETAILIVIEHRTSTDKIKSVMGESIKGDFSDTIPIESLVSDLELIRNKLDMAENFPFDLEHPNVHELLAVVTTRARINNRFLIIEVSVPMVENQTFELQKSMPIPIIGGDFMFAIQTSQKHLLVDKVAEEIIVLPEDDFNKCIKLRSIFVCQTNAPVMMGDDSCCEAAVMFDRMIEPSGGLCKILQIPTITYVNEINSNSFVITPANKTKIKTSCNGTVENRFIEKQIILDLKSGCAAQLNNIKLKRHESFQWSNNKILNFEISLKNLNFSHFKHLDENFLKLNFSEDKVVLNDRFDAILKSVDELENKQRATKKLERLELNDDIHSFSLFGIGTFTLIIIIVLIYLVISKLCPIARAIAKMANPQT